MLSVNNGGLLRVYLSTYFRSIIEKRFDDLSELLENSGFPGWSSVFFVEDFYINSSSRQTIERDRLQSITQFSGRFDALLSEGHGWLNMSGLGLLNNDLIVAIEKPSSNSPSFSCGISNTSVNLSGPTRCVENKNFDLNSFIRIKE